MKNSKFMSLFMERFLRTRKRLTTDGKIHLIELLSDVNIKEISTLMPRFH